ncbi:CYP-14A4 protein [Aphelenchoides avenae]|nr:CYP-14A4 protein [Aphelenchus avenae]
MYYSVMRDDPVWVDPDSFRPGRYLHDDGVTFRKELLERTVPFGMGKRLCAGESLARSQMFLIWTTLFQRYQFIANGPIDMEANFGLILQPSDHHGRIVPRF